MQARDHFSLGALAASQGRRRWIAATRRRFPPGRVGQGRVLETGDESRHSEAIDEQE